MNNNLPTESGLYFASSDNFKWYNLIVEVYGDSPFFRINVWDRYKVESYADTVLYNINQWGPKIEIPKFKSE